MIYLCNDIRCGFTDEATDLHCQEQFLQINNVKYLPNRQLKPQRRRKPIARRKPRGKHLILRNLRSDIPQCKNDPAADHKVEGAYSRRGSNKDGSDCVDDVSVDDHFFRNIEVRISCSK